MERKTKASKNFVAETPSQRILIEEYRALHSDYQMVRSEGVTRVNFFITSASVALGGVFVLGSSETMPTLYFKIIMLLTLALLCIIGLEIHHYLIQRDIGSERYIRGLACIRKYFVEIDPSIESYFVNPTNDVSTGYLTKKSSGMRKTTQIIEGFFVGSGSLVLSTFLPVPLSVNVGTGIATAILTVFLLEVKARRRLDKAVRNVTNETKIGKSVIKK